MVLGWRNHPEISKWMIDQNEITVDQHLKFIESLKSRDDSLYWLVYNQDSPMGVVSSINVDYKRKKGFFGYYISPELLNNGNGLEFNYYCRNFYFNILNFEVLYGNIVLGNTKPYLLSLFLGVKPKGIEKREEQKYLKMKGTKEDFNRVNFENITSQFVKFVKQTKVNWETLEKSL
jgi:UDP-4-amino-4,6-dideoxy-N-acetyl-beta-L-altrosamine N-acetyltransferase